jgi:hypothetical protein
VAMKDYNLFFESPIEAYTDLKDVDIRVTENLKISLRNVPSYINTVRHNPQEVEYIFERR